MTTTTCQRCNGIGRIDAFGHYAGGVCFACSGAGTVRAGVSEAGTGPKQASRVVDVDGQPVTVFRYGAGFRADDAHGCLWFDLDGRRLTNVMASDALPRGRAARIVATLSARCTA